MDDLFTSELNFKEKKISYLLGNEIRVSPKESTLDFIKNFARNFRAVKNEKISLQGFILN